MVGSGQGANAPSDKKLKQLVGVYVVGMKVMVTVMDGGGDGEGGGEEKGEGEDEGLAATDLS